jgi:hypothetical protein
MKTWKDISTPFYHNWVGMFLGAQFKADKESALLSHIADTTLLTVMSFS